jgi:hypothetical protein
VALEGEAKDFSEWMVMKMSSNIPNVLGEKPNGDDPIASIDTKDYKSMIDGGKSFAAGMDLNRKGDKELADAISRLDNAKRNLAEYKKKAQEEGVPPSLSEAEEERLIDEYYDALDNKREKRRQRESSTESQFEALKNKLIDHHRANGYTRDQAIAATNKFRTISKAFGEGETNWKSLDKKTMQEYKDIAADVFELTGGKGARSIGIVIQSDDRAWAMNLQKDGYNVVNVGKGASRETLMHETAHHIEYENPNIAKSSQEFVKSRASGPPQQLKELTGRNYRDDEIAYPDKFISPYVGKITNTGYSSEVISMGLERFSSPKAMQEFYKADPEHFYFTLGAMLS